MDVHSADQLEKISEKDEIHIVDDITVSESFDPIENFEGIIHGNGYTISGLQSYFIKKVEENSVISEITFKNVSFAEPMGVFEENNGCIDSISVRKLRKDYGVSRGFFGGIVGKNYGSIKNCSVLDSVIYHHGNVGCICASSDSGSEIVNCHVKSTKCTQNGKYAGGIVASGVETTIKNCSVSNSQLNCRSDTGGIAGSCKDVKISNVCVKSCDLECDKGGLGGVVADGVKTEITDSLIHTVDLTARSNISFVGKVNYGRFVGPEDSNGEDGLVKSCSVINCSATGASEYGVDIFSKRGIVKDCFVENSEITTLDPSICTDLKELHNSYVDIEIKTDNSVNVRESSSTESFYITIMEDPLDAKTISVSKPKDLEDVGKNDTVELVSDIDLDDYTFNKIEIFSGEFNGNGYTIYNLTKPLFNYLTGTVKDVNITQPSSEIYVESGFLSKSIEDGILRNISITKDHLKPAEYEIYGLSHNISDSSIKNCTVSFDFEDELEIVCGFSEFCTRSVVQDCSIDIKGCTIKRGSGISYDLDRSTLRNIQTRGEIELAENSKMFGGLVGKNDNSKVLNCSSKISIKSDSTSIYKSIGGVIASSYADSIIRHCSFEGYISLPNISGNLMCSIGGIIGTLNHGVVKDCHNTADIYISGNADIAVGGICGKSEGEIIGSSNQGDITGKNKVGGLVGILQGKILKSKSTGNVSGTEKVGGITGIVKDTNSIITNCYIQSVISGEDETGVVLGSVSENVQIKHVYFIPSTGTQKSKYAVETSITEDELDVVLNM